MARREKLAINRLRESKDLDQQTLERFVEKHDFPILEGTQATFVAWQQADQVFLRHRVVGIPDQLPLRRIEGTDLWYVVVEIPGTRGWSTSSRCGAVITGSGSTTR